VDDVVFIAMAHHQLRHGPEAREALDRVRTMLAAEQARRRAASPPNGSTPVSADADLRALYEEATALIGR
jgi:hypothetical protein